MYCVTKSRSDNSKCVPIKYHAGLQENPNDLLRDSINHQMLRYASFSHCDTYTSF